MFSPGKRSSTRFALNATAWGRNPFSHLEARSRCGLSQHFREIFQTSSCPFPIPGRSYSHDREPAFVVIRPEPEQQVRPTPRPSCSRPSDDPPHRAAPSRPHPAHPLGETARLRGARAPSRALAGTPVGHSHSIPAPNPRHPAIPTSTCGHAPVPPLLSQKTGGGASSLFPGRVPEPAPIYTPFTQRSPAFTRQNVVFTQQNVAFTQSVRAAVPRNSFPLNHLPKITPGPAFFSPTLAAPRSQKTGGGAQLCPLRFAILTSSTKKSGGGAPPLSLAKSTNSGLAHSRPPRAESSHS